MSSDILIGKHIIPIYQTQIATFCFEFAISNFNYILMGTSLEQIKTGGLFYWGRIN